MVHPIEVATQRFELVAIERKPLGRDPEVNDVDRRHDFSLLRFRHPLDLPIAACPK